MIYTSSRWFSELPWHSLLLIIDDTHYSWNRYLSLRFLVKDKPYQVTTVPSIVKTSVVPGWHSANTETARQSTVGKLTTSHRSPKVVVMHCQTCALCSGRTTWLSLTEDSAVLLLQKETIINVSNSSSFRKLPLAECLPISRLRCYQRCNLFPHSLHSPLTHTLPILIE